MGRHRLTSSGMHHTFLSRRDALHVLPYGIYCLASVDSRLCTLETSQRNQVGLARTLDIRDGEHYTRVEESKVRVL